MFIIYAGFKWSLIAPVNNTIVVLSNIKILSLLLRELKEDKLNGWDLNHFEVDVSDINSNCLNKFF